MLQRKRIAIFSDMHMKHVNTLSKQIVEFLIYDMVYVIWYIGCPTTYQTRHFFNNSKTNEDIVTKQTHTTDTFLFITHTTNVLLFKSRCNIFIGFRIIKEMPGLVRSGTPCIIWYMIIIYIFINYNWVSNRWHWSGKSYTNICIIWYMIIWYMIIIYIFINYNWVSNRWHWSGKSYTNRK